MNTINHAVSRVFDVLLWPLDQLGRPAALIVASAVFDTELAARVAASRMAVRSCPRPTRDPSASRTASMAPWKVRSSLLTPFHRTSTLALRQRMAILLRQAALPPNLLRASFVERFTTCGKPTCACASGPKHGYAIVEHLRES